MARWPSSGSGGPETDPVASADLDAHEAATAAHGIADTAVLETQAGAQARADLVTVDLGMHASGETPHPVYDDGPSLKLLYENAKV